MTKPMKKERDFNRDPITGEPGSHPVGVGIGTATGAAAGGMAGVAAVSAGAASGALTGSAAGPVGTAVGAATGAIVGGIAGAAIGKELAEEIDPTAEEAYWKDNYQSRPYITEKDRFETYGPAYRYGVDSYKRLGGRKYTEVESQLQSDWEKKNAVLPWSLASHAVRDSYTRLSDRYPQD